MLLPAHWSLTMEWVPHPLRPTSSRGLTIQIVDAKGGFESFLDLDRPLNIVVSTKSTFVEDKSRAGVLSAHPLRPFKFEFSTGLVGRKGWGTHGLVRDRKSAGHPETAGSAVWRAPSPEVRLSRVLRRQHYPADVVPEFVCTLLPPVS